MSHRLSFYPVSHEYESACAGSLMGLTRWWRENPDKNVMIFTDHVMPRIHGTFEFVRRECGMEDNDDAKKYNRVISSQGGAFHIRQHTQGRSGIRTDKLLMLEPTRYINTVNITARVPTLSLQIQELVGALRCCLHPGSDEIYIAYTDDYFDALAELFEEVK